MRLIHSSQAQLRSIRPAIGLILAVCAIFLGTVLILHLWKGIRVDQLTRDPTAITGARPYVGFLSTIGLFFWSATASVCFLGAVLMNKQRGLLRLKRFLFASGLLILLLGFDDAFLLHEDFLPQHVGIPERLVYVGYAALGLFYLVRFNAVILNTDYLLLLLAWSLLGVSVSLDILLDRHIISLPRRIAFLLEDGAKFAGIVSWLVYSARVVESAMDRKEPRGIR